jgi:hypothetical protein
MVRHGWPYFGLTTTVNAAASCAAVSSISAGQHRNGQVAGTRDTVYGSDDRDQHGDERDNGPTSWVRKDGEK